MPTPAIIQRVKEVHADLGATQPDFTRAPDVDVEAIKQQLATVMLDPSKVVQYKSLGDQLLRAYVVFEVAHPKLAAAMVTLANDLAQAGL